MATGTPGLSLMSVLRTLIRWLPLASIRYGYTIRGLSAPPKKYVSERDGAETSRRSPDTFRRHTRGECCRRLDNLHQQGVRTA